MLMTNEEDLSTVSTRFLPLTVSVIVRVRGKLVRFESEVPVRVRANLLELQFVNVRDQFV